jgi:hypothetical protein
VDASFDKKRFSEKQSGYSVGPATALADPMLYARTQEYKRRLSGQMRPISGKDLYKIPKTKGYYGMRKYDGEFMLFVFDGENGIAINPGGTVRVGLPALDEAVELLKKAKVKSCMLGIEIYAPLADSAKRGRVYDVSKVLRNPKSAGELKTMSVAVFDIVELDGKPVPSADEVYKKLDDLFGDGKLVHGVEYRVLKDLEEVEDLFTDWVIGEGGEGLVVRHDRIGWYKIKMRHSLDVAVIGFSEGIEDRKGMLHDLLVAVMRDDGTFHEFARVGGGFKDEERKTFVKDFKKKVVPSDYVAVNNDYVAYEMLEPGTVIEISCLDMITENSKGDPINRMVLEWDGKKYTALSRLPLASAISPQFIRLREDKEAVPEDVNIRQLAAMAEVPDTKKSASKDDSKPSKIIERQVYRKVMKGKKMVRKLLLWETNKGGETGEFPGYVVYLTDFSPNRQNPLERDIRVSNKLKTAKAMFDQIAEKKFIGGWEKVE